MRAARKRREYVLKNYNKASTYIFSILAVVVFFTAFPISSITGVRTFTVTTIGNEPTLVAGDWLVADLDAYKNQNPAYGDIVIVRWKDGQFYPFRVIGLPGDRIDLTNDFVVVNGKKCSSTFIKELPDPYTSINPSYRDRGNLLEFEEVLPN